jgi:hypothetical protein
MNVAFQTAQRAQPGQARTAPGTDVQNSHVRTIYEARTLVHATDMIAPRTSPRQRLSG